MKKVTIAGAALLVSLISASPSSAQTWSTVGSNGNDGGQFWDNASVDGQNCNIGFVLAGTSGTAGSPCDAGRQRPSGWLPYSGANPTHYLNAGGGAYSAFNFSAGIYTFELNGGLKQGGDIAGGNANWGYWSGSTANRTNLNVVAPAASFAPVTVTFVGTWGLWIEMTNSNGFAFSGDALGTSRQFSLFGFNNTTPVAGGLVAPGEGQIFMVGLEDNKWNQGGADPSDRDYQDVVFRITAAPEPSTYLLMGAGLIALGGVARRRRSVA